MRDFYLQVMSFEQKQPPPPGGTIEDLAGGSSLKHLSTQTLACNWLTLKWSVVVNAQAVGT